MKTCSGIAFSLQTRIAAAYISDSCNITVDTTSEQNDHQSYSTCALMVSVYDPIYNTIIQTTFVPTYWGFKHYSLS